MGCGGSKGYNDITNIESLYKLQQFNNKVIDTKKYKYKNGEKAVIINIDEYINNNIQDINIFEKYLCDAFGYEVGQLSLWRDGLFENRKSIVDELKDINLIICESGRQSVFDTNSFNNNNKNNNNNNNNNIQFEELLKLYELLLLKQNKSDGTQFYIGTSHHMLISMLIKLLQNVIEQAHQLVFGATASSDDDLQVPDSKLAPTAPASPLHDPSENKGSTSPRDETPVAAVRFTRAISSSPIEILSELSEATQKIDVVGNRIAIFNAQQQQQCMGYKHKLFAYRARPKDKNGLVEAVLKPYEINNNIRKELKNCHEQLAQASGYSDIVNNNNNNNNNDDDKDKAPFQTTAIYKDTITPETILFLNFAFISIRRIVEKYREYFSHSQKFGWLLNLPCGLEIIASAKSLDCREMIAEVGLVAIHFSNLLTKERHVVYTMDIFPHIAMINEDEKQQGNKKPIDDRLFQTLLQKSSQKQWPKKGKGSLSNGRQRAHSFQEPKIELFVKAKVRSDDSNGPTVAKSTGVIVVTDRKQSAVNAALELLKTPKKAGNK